jgi:hypothetical protein
MGKALWMSFPVQVLVKPHQKTPILLEVPIPENLEGPFLVTSSRSQIWIDEKFPSGFIRAAITKAPKEFLFREAMLSIFKKSRELSWGSVNPATKEGVQDTLAHLAFYGLVDVQVYYGDGFDLDLLPEGIPSSEEVWVPARWAVLLPKDKSFVGTLFDFGQDRNALVIHNAPRGVGLVVQEEE